jgi:hypothetical protein
MFDPDQILKTELIPKVPGLSAAAAVDGNSFGRGSMALLI